jgi:hypothetical protein
MFLMQKKLSALLLVPSLLILSGCRGNIVSEDRSSNIRAVNTSCLTYRATYPERGYPTKLSQLGPPDSGTQPDAEHSGMVDGVLASGKKSGYIITYIPGLADNKGRVASYQVTERPQRFGENGTISFFSDQSGVIHFTNEDRAPTVEDPELKR